MAATVEDDAPYQRKLDRSRENTNFYALPADDKRLISNMRSALEGTRAKITKMRDEIDDKDLNIGRETALRKAAETRLEQLVDMYGDPAVMEELRERLPRAGKTDPKHKWQQELEELRKAEAASLVQGGDPDLGDKAGKKRTHQSRTMGDDSDSDGGENHLHSPPHSRAHHTGYPPYPMGYGMPMAGYPSPPYPGYMPAMYSYPTAQMMAPGSGSGAGAAGSMPVAPAGLMPQMVLAVTPQSVVQTQGGSTAAGGAAAEDGAAHATTSPLGPGEGGMKLASVLSKSSPNLTVAAAHDPSVSREHNRQISMLLKELDAAKELNEKLQHQLTETERELERLKISQQTTQAAAEAEATNKVADLVEEIYRAQRQRDEAILGRLRLANEERDEALLKLKQTREGEPDGSDFDGDDQLHDVNIPELLSMIEESDSAQDIGHHGNKLLKNLAARQERRRLVTTEEMRAVLEERDTAVAQCKHVEAELLRLQRQLRAHTSETQMQATTQAKLLATQQERDMALNKVRKMEDELQNLRMYYSLHKSLSQEANLRDQFNNSLENIEGQLRQRDGVVDATAKENSRLMAQLRALKDDKAQVVAQMEKAQLAQKDAQANCQKLERLVNVLRRKLNGLGTKSDE